MKNSLLHAGMYLIVFVFCSSAMAQDPTLEWLRRYDTKDTTTVSTNDAPIAIAVDADGNSYVIGTLKGVGVHRIATVKYSSTGEQLWEVQLEDGSNASAIAVDNAGNVYVAGTSINDFITIRYDAATGEQIWASRYNEGFSVEYASAIALDNDGGVYVTGSIYSSANPTDYLTVGYDAATGEQRWAMRYDAGTNREDKATAIATDNAGGVYVSGYSDGGASGHDYATLRYNAATGEQRWVMRYNGPANGSDQAHAIAISNKGAVYVTGSGTGYVSGSNETTVDLTTISYNAATGQQLWTNSYNGPANGSDQAHAIALDNLGGLYVTGTSTGIGTGMDYATVGYDAATGEQRWAMRYDAGTNREDKATAIATDNAGGVYVSGYSDGGASGHDYATLRYNAATGEQRWVMRYNGPANGSDQAHAIAPDNQGGLLVAGASTGVNSRNDYATIRYEAVTGHQSWVMRYDGRGNMLIDDIAVAVAVDARGNVYVAGNNSNQVTNMLHIIALKYSADGELLWTAVYEAYSETWAMEIDDDGNVYVTGISSEANLGTDYITIRFDAEDGNKRWVKHYNAEENSEDWAFAITTDNLGGVYVTGSSAKEDRFDDIVTIRYNADTGEETWVSRYDSGISGPHIPSAIVVDEQGALYVTGQSNSDYVTIRYNAATGEQLWDNRYDSGENKSDAASAIAVDNKGSVYVTGGSYTNTTFYDNVTIRYDAATGEQVWVNRYDWENNYNDWGRAIAVDNQGNVYVTGSNFATIRYDYATGARLWVNRDDTGSTNPSWASAIVVDNQGSVFVVGSGSRETGGNIFAIAKYSAVDGTQLWYDEIAENGSNLLVDMALDTAGNLIITGHGYAYASEKDLLGILTIKYRQQQSECPALTEAFIAGPATVEESTTTSYTLAESGATTFNWSITDNHGHSITDFTGQGTASINVRWPQEPRVYKLLVRYGGFEGCPSLRDSMYIHSYDPEAGFITGNGWITSPAYPQYEFMQDASQAYYSFIAKYSRHPADALKGAALFVLESGDFTFLSTSYDAGSLVVENHWAYVRGKGRAISRGRAGLPILNERKFGFLLTIWEGTEGPIGGVDRLRLMVWELNSDGRPGAVVYDNQVDCTLFRNLEAHAPACSPIDKGFINIHRPQVLPWQAQAPLLVYPNALSKTGTARFTLESGGAYSLDLYNKQGQWMGCLGKGVGTAGQLLEQRFSVENLPKDLYLLRLSSTDQLETIRIIVQH